MNKRSLAGYSLWGCKQLDMTEVTWHAGTRIKYWRSLCASVGLIHKNIKVRTFLDLTFFDSLCSLTKDGGGEWDKNIIEIREFSQRQNKMRVNKDLGKEKGVCESVSVFFFSYEFWWGRNSLLCSFVQSPSGDDQNILLHFSVSSKSRFKFYLWGRQLLVI